MNALDWVVVAVLGASILLGLLRGFMRETISLAGWIAGIWLAFRFAVPISASVPLAQE
jgi:membrane protein required for colicin V production